MKKRLVFIVEGKTERILVGKTIIPYLQKKFDISMDYQTIITNRELHKKGGVPNFDKFANDVKRTLAQGNVIVTTLIDFYGLPESFPNFTKDSKKISNIENGIKDHFKNDPNLIPYIQRHELEALMFANRDGLNSVIDDKKKMEEVDKIITTYPNPEDINNSPETAPSKRLNGIFGYNKVDHSDSIFQEIGMDNILAKCPRFSKWIDEIIKKLSE